MNLSVFISSAVLTAVYLSSSVLTKSLPVPSPLIQQAPQSISFLKKYGYLPGANSDALETLYTQESVEDAIKQAQRFGGLEETGRLNEETIKLFSSKRCGLPDVIRNNSSFTEPSTHSDDGHHHNEHFHHHHSHHINNHHGHAHRRKKRFILTGSSWSRRHLKFYIKNWSQSLSQTEVVGELQKTLDIWGKYANLQFSRTFDSNDAEITVGFYKGQHGDMNPFDGRGNVLAHAFFPDGRNGRGLAGDVHFDDDEAWGVGKTDSPFRDTVDFTSVALHELGHSLGLHHSPEANSVMSPYYRGKTDLGDDDVRAMYELYVKRSFEGGDEDIHREDEERARQDEERRRRYDEEKRRWEEKRKEVERKRLEAEEKQKLDDAREAERRRLEEEKRIREEERLREEEERKYELEKRLQERNYELERKRIEEERKYELERRQKEENDKRWYEAEKKRQEEARKKLEEERRMAIEREYQKKVLEDERRRWGQDQSTVTPSKTGRPVGTTFEGDDESVDTHKQHDSTHSIPPNQNAYHHHDQIYNPAMSVGCSGGFSAATNLRGELFFVKDNMLWRLSRPGSIHDKFPVEFQRFFHLIPEEVKTIDAMYERDRDSSLIIFSGRQYWEFDGVTMSGSRPLQDFGLPRDVDRVDAVTSKNGQVLVFSGNRYWALNDTTLESPLQRLPPRPISALKGLPDRLDAALTYNDVIYFFKGDRFWYKDHNSDGAILHNTPASDYWIGC